MSEVPDAAPEYKTGRTHLAAWVGVLLGSAISLISMTTLSWYTLAGAGVANDPRDLGSTDGPVFLLPRDIGRHHSVSWILLIACVAAAVVALTGAKYEVPARIGAGVLAGSLIAVAVVKVSFSSLVAKDAGLDTGAHMHVVVRYGFWTALAGYALLGLAMLAMRAAPPNKSR
jgi:hypothetical protein